MEMHDEDAACPFREVRLEGGRIGPQIVEPDVDRNRRNTSTLQRLDGGDEAVGLEKHFVAGAEPGREYGEEERIGAGGDPAHVPDPEVGGHLRLECPRLVAAEQMHTSEHALARRKQLVPM